MNLTDALTIQAFTAILPKVEMTLTRDIKQAIHDTGLDVSQHHIEQAAVKMRRLAKQHRCIEDEFSPLYREFREKSKFSRNLTPESQSASSLESQIVTMTVPILNADNFSTSAKEVVRRARQHIQDLPVMMHLFITSLQKAVSSSDTQVNIVLRALEQQLLSAEDIAHVLNTSVEQANQILQSLWDKGYIDSANSSVVGRAMAVITGNPRRIPSNSATHFVLTSRGHFHLHPLLLAREKDVLE